MNPARRSVTRYHHLRRRSERAFGKSLTNLSKGSGAAGFGLAKRHGGEEAFARGLDDRDRPSGELVQLPRIRDARPRNDHPRAVRPRELTAERPAVRHREQDRAAPSRRVPALDALIAELTVVGADHVDELGRAW